MQEHDVGRGFNYGIQLLLIFGTCKITGTTEKDNMSGLWVIQSREELLSWLEDHKLRVSVRCMCLTSA